MKYFDVLAVLPDGRIASGSVDGTVRIWDPDGVREPRVLEGHLGHIAALAVLPDGRLASGSDDGMVRIWDPDGVREPGVLDGHRGHIAALAVLPDGRLASGSHDCTVRMWDTRSGRQLAVFVADAPISVLVATGADTLAAADDSGAVHFLKLHL